MDPNEVSEMEDASELDAFNLLETIQWHPGFG
jgi:hypothetical protein